MSKNELNGSALLDDVSFDKPASATRTVEVEDTPGASDATLRPAAASASESSGDSKSLGGSD